MFCLFYLLASCPCLLVLSAGMSGCLWVTYEFSREPTAEKNSWVRSLEQADDRAAIADVGGGCSGAAAKLLLPLSKERVVVPKSGSDSEPFRRRSPLPPEKVKHLISAEKVLFYIYAIPCELLLVLVK